MKILLDECLPVVLRVDFSGHDVWSVAFKGWKGIRNGTLLSLAAQDGFKALLTMDQEMEREQNPATLPLAVVILHAPKNTLQWLRPLVPSVLNTLSTLQPRKFVHVHK